MYYQAGARIQRPKGFKATQGLQVALILIFCIWILYQIKNSHHNKKDYGQASHQNRQQDVGRKAYPGSRWDVYESMDLAISKKIEKNQVSGTIDNKIRNEVRGIHKKKKYEIVGQLNETEGQGEPAHEFTGFSDENGVPIENHQLARYSLNDHHQDMSNSPVRTKSEGSFASLKTKGENVLGRKTDAGSEKSGEKHTVDSAVRGESKAFGVQSIVKNITVSKIHQ